MERSFNQDVFKELKTNVDTRHPDDLHVHVSNLCTNEASRKIFSQLENLDSKDFVYVDRKVHHLDNIYTICQNYNSCTCTFNH